MFAVTSGSFSVVFILQGNYASILSMEVLTQASQTSPFLLFLDGQYIQDEGPGSMLEISSNSS